MIKIITLFFLLSGALSAENDISISVHLSKEWREDIYYASIDYYEENMPESFSLRMLAAEKKIGSFVENQKRINEMFVNAVSYDFSSDPLLGDGVTLIIKTSTKKYYEVFYEFRKEILKWTPLFVR